MTQDDDIIEGLKRLVQGTYVLGGTRDEAVHGAIKEIRALRLRELQLEQDFAVVAACFAHPNFDGLLRFDEADKPYRVKMSDGYHYGATVLEACCAAISAQGTRQCEP